MVAKYLDIINAPGKFTIDLIYENSKENDFSVLNQEMTRIVELICTSTTRLAGLSVSSWRGAVLLDLGFFKTLLSMIKQNKVKVGTLNIDFSYYVDRVIETTEMYTRACEQGHGQSSFD